jgi:hypothetical protein
VDTVSARTPNVAAMLSSSSVGVELDAIIAVAR